MNETLKSVRNKVIAAVPEIVISKAFDESYCREISLADILRAADSSWNDVYIDTEGQFHEFEESEGFEEPSIEPKGIFWNLSLDLDRQLPEVWAFLDRVLK